MWRPEGIALHTEMVLMLAGGAGVSRQVVDGMVEHSLDAGRKYATAMIAADHKGEILDGDEFYPFRLYSFFGREYDAERANYLKQLQDRLAEMLDTPAASARGSGRPG